MQGRKNSNSTRENINWVLIKTYAVLNIASESRFEQVILRGWLLNYPLFFRPIRKSAKHEICRTRLMWYHKLKAVPGWRSPSGIHD
jgi:hypothetical protein